MARKIDLELDSIILDNYFDLKELLEKQEPRNSEVRNATTILRRFLIHGDLNKSAISRNIRLSFFIPIVEPYLKCVDLGLFKFWLSADADIFGVKIMGMNLGQGPKELVDAYLDGINPEEKIEVKLSSFLKSPVAAFDRKLVSREEVLKYVANKTGADHYDPDRDDSETISRIRGMVKVSLQNKMPSINFNMDALHKTSDQFVFKRNEIDPLLIEILSTSKYIIESPKVQELVQDIEKDIK